jgi:formamidopyrimidine-DNA glycosylase
MPELPEVETVVRGLAPALTGRRILAVELRRPDLRLPFPEGFCQRLTGARITGLSRRAKYILVATDKGCTLLVHLGMTGRFSLLAGPSAANLGAFYFEQGSADGRGLHDHVVIDLDDGCRVVFSDPRRFGLMDLVEEGAEENNRHLRGLGVEPLGNDFNAAYLAARFKDKTAPLKAALLDQGVIAGLGNIYVSEALHRAGLSPRRLAGTLVRRRGNDPRLDLLVRHIRDILNEAIRAGGSTLQDFAGADGAPGAYQQSFAVYDREGEPCSRPSCGGTIRRIVQSGRSTFYCSRCQK